VDKTITNPPHTLFYRDKGVGAPNLLLHGFAEDGTVWDNQIETLSRSCRLIVPDLPGSGRSSAINTAISIEGMAAMIKDLLD
jgi:pimeloyl-ACP methyl ester carboxylesterase